MRKEETEKGCERKRQKNSVLILDGNSEIVAHTRSNICYLSCIRHLVRLRETKNWIFFSTKSSIILRQRQRKNVEERDRERIWKKETEKGFERKRDIFFLLITFLIWACWKNCEVFFRPSNLKAENFILLHWSIFKKKTRTNRTNKNRYLIK